MTAAYIFPITLIDGDALVRLAQRGFGFLGDVGAEGEVNGGKVGAALREGEDRGALLLALVAQPVRLGLRT